MDPSSATTREGGIGQYESVLAQPAHRPDPFDRKQLPVLWLEIGAPRIGRTRRSAQSLAETVLQRVDRHSAELRSRDREPCENKSMGLSNVERLSLEFSRPERAGPSSTAPIRWNRRQTRPGTSKTSLLMERSESPVEARAIQSVDFLGRERLPVSTASMEEPGLHEVPLTFHTHRLAANLTRDFLIVGLGETPEVGLCFSR